MSDGLKEARGSPMGEVYLLQVPHEHFHEFDNIQRQTLHPVCIGSPESGDHTMPMDAWSEGIMHAHVHLIKWRDGGR